MKRDLDSFRTSPLPFRAVLCAAGLMIGAVAVAHAQVDSLPVPDTLAVPVPAAAAPISDTLAAMPDTAIAPPAPPSRARNDSPIALRGHGRPNILKSTIQNAKNFVSDAIYLYTSPLRMSGKNVAITGGALVVGAGLYQYDQELFDRFLEQRDTQIYQSVVVDAGGFLEPLGLISATHWWLTGASVAGWLFDVPLLRTIPGEIMESNSIVGPMRQPIETTVHRRRPMEGEGARSFTGGRSFPSGHASVICETAAILSHHAGHPIARTVIWSAAAVACLERLDDPVLNHWPSDVWMGAALGAYCGHTIAVRNEERRHGVEQAKWYDIFRRPDRNWSVMPAVGPGSYGLNARAQF